MAPKEAAKDLQKYPKFRQAFIKAVQKAQDRGIMQTFKNPEEAIQWWVSGVSLKQFRANKLQYKIDFNKEK